MSEWADEILNDITVTSEMIDADGYRANVGIILCNQGGQVMWARRVGQDAWQFPQGGIAADEDPQEAGAAPLAGRIGLPARWVTDGQGVPEDLHGAPDRLVSGALRRGKEPSMLQAIA